MVLLQFLGGQCRLTAGRAGQDQSLWECFEHLVGITGERCTIPAPVGDSYRLSSLKGRSVK